MKDELTVAGDKDGVKKAVDEINRIYNEKRQKSQTVSTSHWIKLLIISRDQQYDFMYPSNFKMWSQELASVFAGNKMV